MKQTRLLEIIREEISEAVNALVTTKTGETKTMPYETPEDKAGILILKKDNNIKNIETTAGVNIKEDDLNEVPDFGGRYDQQVAAKYGEDQTLEDATKDITDEILKDMGVSRDDLKKDADKAKDVLKAIRSKVVGKARDPRVAKALEKQEEFDDSGNALQANQTNNAILKALGLKEPGQRGRKASEKSEPKEKSTKAKAEKSPKAEKTATLTKGDDEFDTVNYSDDEGSAEAMKAAGSDETAKELSSTPEEKKVKFNQFLASVKKNKDDKAKIDGILKLAKDKFKFAKTMMDDLKRAAGREVEV
jgi:hypothetical protein